MNKIKVGLIGAGSIVESNHLPVLKATPNVDVSWVFDISKSRVELLSSMYGVKGITDNIEQAINEVDLVAMTVPYGVRKEYYKQIAAANKAIYVEKPFALSVAEHNEYCNLFPPHKIAVGFQRRCYNYVAMLSNIINTKVYGNLHQIEFTQGYFSMKGGSGYLSNAKLAGGGVIVESAIHILDQILLFTQATQVQLQQIKSLIKDGIDYDSSFTSGITTNTNNIEVICQISSVRNLSNGLKLKFDNATIELDPSPTTEIKVTPIKGGNSFYLSNDANATKLLGNVVTQSFYKFWQLVFDAAISGNTNISSGNTSLLTTNWIEQIYTKIS